MEEEQHLPRVDWETSLVANESRSRRTAWRVAAIATLIAALEAIALSALAPLHSVVPYVVSVDRATGDALVAPTGIESTQTQTLNDKHWISEFIVSRERYVFALLQHDYDTVQRFSSPGVWAHYAGLYEGEAPLDKKLGESTEILPRILSITVAEAGIATARLEVARHESTGAIRTQRYVATLRYQYHVPMRARESELIANPFGFRVTAYQLDEELTGGGAP
ncbi:MAG: type IV secretion system protein [Burkholderiaceae bacterium]|jgi:type IV secretion system protein VirB8